ncbi:MAG: nucleoside phosphorylase [Chthoniobacterales bacterium]|nr:nucleoside phosphorylase [Chthoniobacterales bacterium]
MRLHRSISLEKPLLVVALEEEAQHLHVSGLPVLVTGVGKICAAHALAAVLARKRPSRVINVGTAGALHEGLSGTQVVGRVLQHDFDDDGIAALTGEHFGEPIDLEGDGPTLGSGDVFVSGGDARGRLVARGIDLVDMEGYAVARVAREFGLPVTIVKEISDRAGEGADKTWKQSLDDCAERLGAWLRREIPGA